MTTNTKTAIRSANGHSRIRKVLSYIDTHLHQPLSLDELADHSCWSRWQLQRVFQAETGLSVAAYVRELKLSAAAERLIDSSERVIDIAFTFGFASEVAFSRSFKQMFGVSPRVYRTLEKRTGLRKPIVDLPARDALPRLGFAEVRVESKETFLIHGVHSEIRGLFASEPDFQRKVPLLWQKLEAELTALDLQCNSSIGVVDVTQASSEGSPIQYWAGVALQRAATLERKRTSQLDTLTVPSQTYAVISHRGPIEFLPATLEWFLLHWLPESGYKGVEGYELECYPENYQADSMQAVMQYWVPIS